MLALRNAFAAMAAALLAGCATPPQTPISLAKGALEPAAGSMGVAMSAIPKPAVDVSSAACLLCLIAASAANSSLSQHADKLTYEDLSKLRNELVAVMRKKGINATPVENAIDVRGLPSYKAEGPNIARSDFTEFRAKLQVDRLLVVDVSALGFVRRYAAYFPSGAPQATLRGSVFIVNLKNNVYEYYLPVSIEKAADGAWDEPPSFPGLTNAYYQAIEIGRDLILKPLASP